METLTRRDGSVTKAILAILACVGLAVVAVLYLSTNFNSPLSKRSDSSAKSTKPKTPPKIGLQVGNLAPEIEGEDIERRTFKLSDYRGKVVMLDFWGHW
jgi:hypothetical protein